MAVRAHVQMRHVGSDHRDGNAVDLEIDHHGCSPDTVEFQLWQVHRSGVLYLESVPHNDGNTPRSSLTFDDAGLFPHGSAERPLAIEVQRVASCAPQADPGLPVAGGLGIGADADPFGQCASEHPATYGPGDLLGLPISLVPCSGPRLFQHEHVGPKRLAHGDRIERRDPNHRRRRAC